MEYSNKKYNQKNAYKIIEDKILKSKSYYDFIMYITELQAFNEIFTFENDKFDADIARKSLKTLSSLRYVCNDESGLKKENEFHDFLIEALDSKDTISNIVNTYLIETKYGNPKRVKLNDYTLNDKLFCILEAVFGLDTLILSVSDKKALQDRFNLVMKTNDLEEANKFIGIIEDIYNSVKDAENPDLVNEKIESMKEDLKSYILAGLNQQVNEISNTRHSSFNHYDNLYSKIMDVLKFSEIKKM